MQKCTGLAQVWAKFAFIYGMFSWCLISSLILCSFNGISLRKHSLFSIDCDVNNARNGMLEAHVLIFFSGQHALDPARDSCLWRSWAWPGLKLPPLTGLKCLKLAFLKFKFRFNSAALWIIQLQTHQECLQLILGWGIFCFFLPSMVGHLTFFARYEN